MGFRRVGLEGLRQEGGCVPVRAASEGVYEDAWAASRWVGFRVWGWGPVGFRRVVLKGLRQDGGCVPVRAAQAKEYMKMHGPQAGGWGLGFGVGSSRVSGGCGLAHEWTGLSVPGSAAQAEEYMPMHGPQPGGWGLGVGSSRV